MGKQNDLTDQELLEQARSGSSAALGVVYRRYSGLLILHALDVLEDEEAARDVIQEVFINLWNRREHLQGVTHVKAYLYTAVRNATLNHLKKEQHIAKMLEGFKAESDRLRQEEGEQDTMAGLIRKIESEISRLPVKMREIFLLSRRGDLTYEQISAQLDIAPNTVRKQVSNALRIIRMNLRLLCSWIF
ncbi:sigma-70 family RNA polymerase sigma factor [Chitinophaga pollutisoli]|uniref:Sigma-70 family RNA polymerase sigma factor n=1 Tax=Chitinophaga pollutisoli TaxID=3133966 RepID=A0ABZ2YMH4_9BACT